MKTRLFIGAALLGVPALAQVPSNVPAAGLVAWYPLNNSVVDAGPNGLNGSASGSSASADRFGTAGAASFFNGFSYDQVPSNALFNTGEGMTVCAWVQLTDANANQKIAGRVNGSFNSGYIFGVENGQVHPEVWNAGGTPHTFSAGFIPSGQWTHLAITWATNGYLVAYVNGMAADSIAAGAEAIGSNNEPLIIGGSPWSQNPLYFGVNGSLDDIGIWNRALSPSEISDVFSSGTTGVPQVIASRNAVLYPVPAERSTTIKAASELAGQHYWFVDATGRTVLQGRLEIGPTTVNVERLGAGAYAVVLGDARATAMKFVKR
ncbi:MAG: hypothetical protein JST38_05555 [Bacteroidetes bacterium]|nr:hypothetical protein [Bacteroidota bacterium]MBS1940325.1 hypothetical protein [Bacteroidota bacterium]